MQIAPPGKYLVLAVAPYHNLRKSLGGAADYNPNFARLSLSGIAGHASVYECGNLLEWLVQTEVDMESYDVEKSNDGRSFARQATKQARGNNVSTTAYDWLDVSPNNGNNYYRIKATSKNGQTQYSKIVKVNLGVSLGGMAIYPTPLSGNTFTLQLNTIPKGIYKLRIVNSVGQQVWSKQLQHTGGSSSQTIDLTQNIAGGIYHVELHGGEIRLTKTLFKN